MRHPVSVLSLALAGLVLPPAPAPARDVDFNRDVLPILTARCFPCHGPDAAARKADLRLDARDAAVRDGVITPGRPADSELVVRVGAADAGRRMPPPKAGPALTADQVKTLRQWVEEGAEYADHWAFVPPVRPALPRVRDEAWPRTPIDRFVLHAREQQNLPHAGPAARETLLRRATLDLTGLPPTPDEVDAFLADDSPGAYAKLLDRLLASPHYGERWGRHWLDVARYADSGGFETDIFFAHAWRYRDYVIRSLNADKPFDRFVKEQIAGDELYPGDREAETATGLYTIGPVLQEAAMVTGKLEYDWLTDAADTTAAAFLGLTAGCARCHDHKYDPVSQEDYYALQAVFAGSGPADIKADGIRGPVRDRLLVKTTLPEFEVEQQKARAARETDPAARAALVRQIGAYYVRKDPALQKRLDESRRFLAAKSDRPKPANLIENPDQFLLELGEKHLTGRPEIPTRVLAHRSTPLPVRLLKRGELDAPGDVIAPGLPAKLAPAAGQLLPGRWRAALAEWIASDRNPLTARVIVNRVWQWHFGEGLVRTPNDFGTRGDRPTHPELLDWLAADFVAKGWSLKHLHKTIMLSAAYRMSSAAGPATLVRDPDNRWLTRFQPRRVEAEVVWDAVRAAAGTLDRTLYGLPVAPPLDDQEQVGNFRKWPASTPAEADRRAVYVLSRRSFRFPAMAAFDLPDPAASCGRRDVTTVPTQALTLLNNRAMKEQAAAFARRLAKETGGDPAAVAERAWKIVYGRPITADERRAAVEFLRGRPEPGRAVEELCLALFNTTEFLYLP